MLAVLILTTEVGDIPLHVVEFADIQVDEVALGLVVGQAVVEIVPVAGCGIDGVAFIPFPT